ncbi:FAD-dependent monooxygenase [Spiractinospora alimapuensis]|uniref:FAD-dependent monooxygenase n=1 Tax=Spiractinospora alimapuensis TaxID=2820884 RepID=UPI001F3378B6|nr:FAD-dependent monooxygenase [Spiractinospora alimapuensis]QVQ52841.1 FAD-dependent monooxygenase [Spiractinospora alimapuensis]
MNPTHGTVLISGGGIAGPALAYWLRRAGFTPTVVERAGTIRSGGHRIDLGATGIEMLTRMGVGERIRGLGAPIPNPTLYLGDNDHEITIPVQPNSVGTSIALRRGDVVSTVNSLVADDVEFIFDDSITAIEQSAESTRVSFERGPSRDFDLVVGADGINSNVRSIAYGPRERYAHFLGTNLAITEVENYLGLRDQMLAHTWPHCGLAITTFPGNTALETTFLIRDEEPLDPRGRSPESVFAYVERRFKYHRWEVHNALDRIRPRPDFHAAPSVQIKMPTWTAGRVALVGDAAYCPDPMSGEGTTLALAGAYVLAGELAAARGNPAAAFPAYEKVMREVVKAGQGVAEAGTSMLAPRTGPGGLWLRDQAMRAAVPIIRLGARLGLSLAGTNKVGLAIPTYDFSRSPLRSARGERG